MLLIERLMARLTEFIACDLFGLDSRDIERVRAREFGPPGPPPSRPGDRHVGDRHVVVRFGR